MALVRQREPAGVTQHVGVDPEREASHNGPSPLHHASKTRWHERTSPLTVNTNELGLLLPM